MRVVRGRKSAQDLKLEWLVGGQWVAVPMAAAALLTDFFYENEDCLYPPPAAGGEYLLAYLRQAAENGWQSADARLQNEKLAAQAARDLTTDLLSEINW